MHVPPLPHLAATDPQLAELIEAEAQRQHDKLRMIPSENYVSSRRARGLQLGAQQQVLRGVRGQALLRGPAVRRPGRDAGGRAGRGPVRGRPRQRPAVLRLAGQPRHLPGLHEPGRHVPVARAGPRRPPHARLAGLGHRQVVPAGALRGRARVGPHRHGQRARPGPGRAPENDHLRRYGDPAHDRLPGLRRDRPARSARCSWPTSRTSPAWSSAARTRRRSGTPTSSRRPRTRPCAARAARC